MDIRRVPLEVIQCRHCDKSFQTSEKHLCNSLLYQECFDAREINRKGFPKVIHAKAEHSIGDKYGENRAHKTVICAACGQTYEVYKRLSDKLSRSCLEDAIKNHSHLYSDGPLNGWTNDLLCKSCFDNVQTGCEDEIKQMHELEAARLQKEAAYRTQEETERRRIETQSAGFGKFIFILFLVFAVPIVLSMCSGVGGGDREPTDIYYRK